MTILLLTQKDIFHFKKREFYNPSSCPIGIGEKGRNEMKVGDKIKIKVNHGYWKKGHEGVIIAELFLAKTPDGKTKTYDFTVRLEGDGFCSGFDKSELERRYKR